MTLMTAGLSCKQVGEQGSAFLDGELSTTQWLRFRWHLLNCRPCAEFLRQLDITVDAVRSLPGEEGQQMRGELLDVFEEWCAQGAHDHDAELPEE